MKMIKTISILTLCLAATLAFSSELVPGEMSLSQASKTFGGGCCKNNGSPTCPTTCSGSGNYVSCKDTSYGWETCTASGDINCGDCNKPYQADLYTNCS